MIYKGYLSDIAIVGPGQFSNEAYVQAYDSLGKVMHGFFDKIFIKDGKLEVSVRDSNTNEVILMAPGE